jgi:hypothetical protein
MPESCHVLPVDVKSGMMISDTVPRTNRREEES